MADRLYTAETQKFNRKAVMAKAWGLFRTKASGQLHHFMLAWERRTDGNLSWKCALRWAWNLARVEKLEANTPKPVVEPVRNIATPFDADIAELAIEIDRFDRSARGNFNHPRMLAMEAEMTGLQKQASDYREAA